MSKLKVDEIESNSAGVQLAGKGTGLVKVKGAGGADGTLQLSSGSNGVKLKSPPHSSAQSYTMILPDNNIVQDSFLKVKSVSGTGTNAIGQLEYATQTTVDKTNLNASNFTTGKIPSARIDSSSLTTSANGYGLKFISKGSVSADNTITEITFTNLDADSRYWILGKNIKCSNDGIYNIGLQFLDSSNNHMSISGIYYHEQPNYAGAYVYPLTGQNPTIPLATADYSGQKHGFVGEFGTSNFGFFEALSFSPSSPSKVNRMKAYAGTGYFTGIKIWAGLNGTQYFQSGTEILLYKMET